MKRHIRHIRAGNNEWVKVHRDPPPPSPGQDWFWMLLLKVGGGVVAMFIIGQILKVLMPYLVLLLLGWVALYVFAKGGKR